jgi:chromosome segregation ATPase
MNERAIDELRRLADIDRELASAGARLRELDAASAAVRLRAEAIDAFFARYPDEETRLGSLVAAAQAELARRQAELSEASDLLERAKDEDARVHAMRAQERAVDHVAVATSTLERAEAEHNELEADAGALPSELPELEHRAQEIASEAADVPSPGGGLRELVDWSAHAHAELFVAARQLDAQREAVIREANELASMLLGEPTYGSTVAQVLARVESHWTSSPGQVSESR